MPGSLLRGSRGKGRDFPQRPARSAPRDGICSMKSRKEPSAGRGRPCWARGDGSRALILSKSLGSCSDGSPAGEVGGEGSDIPALLPSDKAFLCPGSSQQLWASVGDAEGFHRHEGNTTQALAVLAGTVRIRGAGRPLAAAPGRPHMLLTPSTHQAHALSPSSTGALLPSGGNAGLATRQLCLLMTRGVSNLCRLLAFV